MKNPNEPKKNVHEKNEQSEKSPDSSNCCGPTCCSSSDKNDSRRKGK